MKAGYALAALALTGTAMLAGCGPKALALPEDPVERAATCGVIATALARAAAGAKGELSADAQARIFHYPLLAGASGDTFEADKADAVFKRMPVLFDEVTQTKWQEAKPACDAAYPQTAQDKPTLPTGQLDSLLQCYMVTDFMRKGLSGQGSSYADAVLRYGQLTTKLDSRVAKALEAAGVTGEEAVRARRNQALAAAAKLGRPDAVIEACRVKYD